MYRIPAHIKIIAGKQYPGWTDSMWNNEIYQQNSREKYQKIYGIKQHRAFSYPYHKNAAGETFVARTPAALMFDFVLCQHFYLLTLFILSYLSPQSAVGIQNPFCPSRQDYAG